MRFLSTGESWIIEKTLFVANKMNSIEDNHLTVYLIQKVSY